MTCRGVMCWMVLGLLIPSVCWAALVLHSGYSSQIWNPAIPNQSSSQAISLKVLYADFFMLAPFDKVAFSSQLIPAAQYKSLSTRSIDPSLVGLPLVYPSPVRASLGGEIGYYLDSNLASIELRIYTMTSQLIYSNIYPAGATGAQLGYNLIKIDASLIGAQLQSGVYFVLLLSKGKVIGKTKFAVVP